MNVPFDEAIGFFRQKVNLPTESWDDLLGGMHSRAFVVAGGAKADLLCDMRTAVDKAISQGTTLQDFRKDFDGLVSKNGWKYKGGRGWRTATIFNTNLSTAYAAGHYQQQMSPAVQKARPFLRYVPSSSANPRAEHTAWYNLILPADHPFWETHYPPNGWGCKCGVVSASAREVERLKEEEKDGPHPIQTEAPKQRYYEWTDKRTGEVLKVPQGIDPGWDYNPGRAAFGSPLAGRTGNWERLTPGGWDTYNRPNRVPGDKPRAAIGKKLTSKAAATTAMQEILGGNEKVFSFKGSGGFRYDIGVNAERLVDHIDLNRTPFLPFIPEALNDPYEVWQSFEKNAGTGQIALKQRVIKVVEMDKNRAVLIVAQTRNGSMETLTMFPTRDMKYLNKQREGKLVYGRD